MSSDIMRTCPICYCCFFGDDVDELLLCSRCKQKREEVVDHVIMDMSGKGFHVGNLIVKAKPIEPE